MATCLVCGMTFEPKSRAHKYCSATCRRENEDEKRRNEYAKFEPVERTCVCCGRKFLAKSERHRCCSLECSRRYNSEQWRRVHAKPKRDRICVVCGNPFAPRNSVQKCCSAECTVARRKQYNREHYQPRPRKPKASVLTYICDNCGQSYQPTSPAQRFCCKSCVETFRATHQSKPKPVKPLEQWQNEAAACGLSYGKYRAALASGKSFEELKL